MKIFINIIVGCISAMILVLLAVLFKGGIPQLLESVLTQTQYYNSIGGLSVLNIFYFIDISSAINWINEYGRAQIIAYASLLTTFVVVIISSIYYAFYFKKSNIKAILQTQIISISTILITAVVVNPQYLIWIMPFLIICNALFDNYRFRIPIISILSTIFAMYWVFPFYSLSFFPAFSEQLQKLHQIYSHLFNGIGYQIMVISGFSVGLILITILFPKLLITLGNYRIISAIMTRFGVKNHE